MGVRHPLADFRHHGARSYYPHPGDIVKAWRGTAMDAVLGHVTPPSSTPTRTPRSLSVAQQTKLRTRLVAELQELREVQERLQLEIAAGIETRRGAQNDETDDPEGASLAFEGAQSSAMLQQARRHADEVAAALARLDGGSYGTCVECDGAIASGRLDARPSTAHCIDCAS